MAKRQKSKEPAPADSSAEASTSRRPVATSEEFRDMASALAMIPMYQESAAFYACRELMIALNWNNRATKAPWLKGFGVGFKSVQGCTTRTVAARVYVDEKLPKSKLGERPKIPCHVDGIPVDVNAPNYSIASTDLQGTDGIRPRDKSGSGRAGIMVVGLPKSNGEDGGGFMFLTAAHVYQVGLAPANRDQAVKMVSVDAGSPIGVSLTGEGKNWFRDEFLDCALLAPVTDGLSWSAGIRDDMPPNARPLGVVERSDVKLGSEIIIPLPSDTGLQNVVTQVISRDRSFDIEDPEVPGQTFTMTGHIIVEPFGSQVRAVVRGDSGTLAVDRDGRAVGIVRAVGAPSNSNSSSPITASSIALVPMSWIVGSLRVWPVNKVS